MTDNEIIKALEDLLKNFDGKAVDFMTISFALDLINRQKAENERLQKDSKRLKKVQMQLDDAMKMYSTIKAEAVKEFAELLKEHIRDYHPYYYVIDEEVVDNLVEEMVGENKCPV